MLAGRRLFDGGDISEILAAVIKDEPPLDGVPEKTPWLLKGCLEKDPRLLPLRPLFLSQRSRGIDA